MGKIAFVFPGQGAAAVGMGREIAGASPAAAVVWAEATAALPALERLCFEGPLDELVQTANAQPAIFAVDCACLAALAAEGIQPDVVAGHSLGEYAALVAAGVLDFGAALRLVRARAEAMQAACARPGTMAAITGLDAAQVEAVVAAWEGEGVLAAANYNSPGQVVVSGDVAAVRWEQSVETMLAAGADTFVEVGPGRTLLGLVRRTAAQSGARPRLANVEDAASLTKTLAALRNSS